MYVMTALFLSEEQNARLKAIANAMETTTDAILSLVVKPQAINDGLDAFERILGATKGMKRNDGICA